MMIKKIFITVLLASGSLLSCRSPSPQWIPSLGYQQHEVFPVSIGSYGYPYVSIRLNGKDQLLPWDTGNMSRLALSKSIAEELGLPVTGQAHSYDSEGNLRGTRSVYRVDSLSLFGRQWSDFRAVELVHPTLDGLVGPYFSAEKHFTLDYNNELIAVSDGPLPEAPAGEEFPMVRSPVHELLILIYTEIDGRRVLTEIDTGKSRSVIDSKLAGEMGLEKTPRGFRIDRLTIGSETFSVPSAKPVNFSGISEGLPEPIRLGIGSDILSELLLTVDYTRGVVLLQPNK